jgi:hypothetical protein
VSIRHPRKREPVLWIVDSEQWPRACLRAELIERGYDPQGFITVDDALASLSEGRSGKPEALILELRGQNLTDESISEIQHLRIPTILLGGSTELNDPRIQDRKWNIVLKRPFSLGEVADVTHKIVSANSPVGR